MSISHALRFVPLWLILLVVAGHAQNIPQTMSYQGLIESPPGKIIADGDYTMQFRLYDVATNGTAFYTETQTVQAKGGLVSVTIGAVTPIPEVIPFNEQYYLGISIGSGSELSPRTQLTSVPYAFRARMAEEAKKVAGDYVTSVNNITGPVLVQAGQGVAITRIGGVLTISAAGDEGTPGIRRILGGAGINATRTDDTTVSLQVPDGGITSAMIADGAITDAKIADGISYSKLSGVPTSLPPSGPAGGDLVGTYPNPTIAVNAVTSAKIADGTITNADVAAAAAIAYSKLDLNNSIRTGDILNDAVTLPKISRTGASPGQVIMFNGTVQWAALPQPLSRTVVAVTSYSVRSTDALLAVQSPGAAVTLTLPAADSVAGGKVIVVKSESGTGGAPSAGLPITINASAGDTIEGATNVTITALYGVRRLYSDGVSTWFQW